jgi:hypothetical protein
MYNDRKKKVIKSFKNINDQWSKEKPNRIVKQLENYDNMKIKLRV